MVAPSSAIQNKPSTTTLDTLQSEEAMLLRKEGIDMDALGAQSEETNKPKIKVSGGGMLNRDSFLKIMTAELKNISIHGNNKDPMEATIKLFDFENAMRNQQMNLTSTFSQLVGNKEVIIKSKDSEGAVFMGSLDAAKVAEDGTAFLTIEGKHYEVKGGSLEVISRTHLEKEQAEKARKNQAPSPILHAQALSQNAPQAQDAPQAASLQAASLDTELNASTDEDPSS